jgi:multicomponent Na+:H+ antiporter subunit E
MGLLFVVCVLFWLVLSGHYTPLYIGLGLLSAAVVTWLNRRDEIVSDVVRALPGLLRYSAWLLWQIVQSNLQVARLVLDPRLPIDPQVVRVRTGMRQDLAVATLANSITLTPGTVTVEIEGDELVVHALTPATAAAVAAGEMARRVARVYGEPAP